MPQTAKNLLLILLVPFLLGLGHDLYINYLSDDEKIRELKALRVDPDKFMMSDLGWVWQEYSPASLEVVRDTFGVATWEAEVDPVLKQPTLLVTIIPFVCGVIALLIAFILGIWPFSRLARTRKQDKAGYGVYKKAKTNKKEYYNKK